MLTRRNSASPAWPVLQRGLDPGAACIGGYYLASPINRNPRSMQTEVKEIPQYAIVASVQLPGVSDVEFEASLTELRELAKTLGFTVIRTFTQKRNGFDSTAYLGVGKRAEIRHFVSGAPDDDAESDRTPLNPLYRLPLAEAASDEAMVSPHPVDVLFVDHEISPSQARNLEKEAGCQVMDRTMVILEIFHRNARSPAARAGRRTRASPAWRWSATPTPASPP